MSPDPEALTELVERITAGVAPRRIILFGSAARGEMGPHSDLDVLVVMPDGCNPLATAQAIHGLLRGFRYPKDIVVVQESEVVQYGDNPYMILHVALKEGKELYRAAS